MHGTYSGGGGSYEAEDGQVLKLAGQVLRVHGEDESYLTNGHDRFKLSTPLN